MVIFFTYLLLIKDASTYKDVYHHDHHATGKEIPHCENCTLTTRFLLGKFKGEIISSSRVNFNDFKIFITPYWDHPETSCHFSPTKKKKKTAMLLSASYTPWTSAQSPTSDVSALIRVDTGTASWKLASSHKRFWL